MRTNQGELPGSGQRWPGSMQQLFLRDQMRCSPGADQAAGSGKSGGYHHRQPAHNNNDSSGWGSDCSPQSQAAPPAWLVRGRPDSTALKQRMAGLRAELGTELALSMGTSHRSCSDAMSVASAVQLLKHSRAEDPIPERIVRSMSHFDSRAVALLLKDLSKVGASAQAFKLFDWLRSLPPQNRLSLLCDVYTFTACISLCMAHHGLDRALQLLGDMKSRGIQRNVHTYTALMNVCIKSGHFLNALEMFQHMRQEGCTPNVVTYNTLIDVYGKLGQWDKAAQVLTIMRCEGVEPALRTYNTLIIACNMCQQPREALAVYQQLLASNVQPNSTTCNALISAYGKLGQLDKVLEVFREMCWKGLERSVITYSSLISACEKAGRWETALQLFEDMQRDNCTPNTVTYNSLITACGQGSQWQRAEQLFRDMQRAGCQPDVVTYTALISALERSGHWLKAYQVFQNMTASGCKPDSIVYNAIIDALWQTGCVWAQAKARALFLQAVSQGHFRSICSSFGGGLGHKGQPAGSIAAAAGTRGRLGAAGAPATPGSRWQLNLHALTAGVAMVSLFQWIQDLRSQASADEGASLPATVSIITDAGNSSREQGNFVVREAVTSLMTFWEAPFRPPAERGQQGTLEGSVQQLLPWLRSSSCDALLISLLPACVLEQPVPSDNEWQLKESQQQRAAQDAWASVSSGESRQGLALQRMPAHYLQQRCQLVTLLMQNGQSLLLRSDLVAGALHLADQLAAGQSASMGTGVSNDDSSTACSGAGFGAVQWADEELPALAVALLRLSAQLASADVPSMAMVASSTQLDVALVLELEHRLQKLLQCSAAGSGAGSSSHSMAGCLQLYLDALGAGLLRPAGAFLVAGLSRMLSCDALFDVALLNCRPSVVAAALLYVERRMRGVVPFWPSSLARLTGVQDLNHPEVSCALRAVQKLSRKAFLACLFKEQAMLLAGNGGRPASAGAVDGGRFSSAAGRSNVGTASDAVLVARAAVMAALEASRSTAAASPLLQMAERAGSAIHGTTDSSTCGQARQLSFQRANSLPAQPTGAESMLLAAAGLASPASAVVSPSTPTAVGHDDPVAGCGGRSAGTPAVRPAEASAGVTTSQLLASMPQHMQTHLQASTGMLGPGSSSVMQQQQQQPLLVPLQGLDGQQQYSQLLLAQGAPPFPQVGTADGTGLAGAPPHPLPSHVDVPIAQQYMALQYSQAGQPLQQYWVQQLAVPPAAYHHQQQQLVQVNAQLLMLPPPLAAAEAASGQAMQRQQHMALMNAQHLSVQGMLAQGAVLLPQRMSVVPEGGPQQLAAALNNLNLSTPTYTSLQWS